MPPISFFSQIFRSDRSTKDSEKSKEKRDSHPKGGTVASSALSAAPCTANVELRSSHQGTPSTAEPAPTVQQPAIASETPPSLTESGAQLAASNTVSHTSSSLPEQLRNQAYDNPQWSSASKPLAENIYHKDGKTTKSLWDLAYDALKNNEDRDKRRLVEKYEELLSKNLSNLITSKGDLPDQAEENVDKTENRIGSANLQERQVQMDTIIKGSLRRMDEKEIKYHIAGHEFVVQDQIAQAAELALGMKDFISEAVKASPAASLVWAGVCVILPLLTNPSAANQANRDGFAYVTTRMRYYVALEPLLWPKNQDSTAANPNLRKEFEKHIIDLYQHILEFQFKSVLRCYRSRWGNLGLNLIQFEDWNNMRSTINSLEAIVHNDSEQLNTLSSRQELESLNENSKGSLEAMRQLLLIAGRQLRVTEEHRDISSKTLQATEKLVSLATDANKFPLESCDANQATVDLPIVENAPYDSEANQDTLCQQGTRISVLNDITAWVDNTKKETIFWAYGPAGTGKSTITRSFAHFLANTGQLGASYFFKRGEEGRNGTARFFPTIASQLVDTIPMYKTWLMKSLERLRNIKIETKALEEQFKTLILTPLSEMIPDKSGILTRVIIIDALDECERFEDIPRILNLFSQLQELSTVQLRVFLTSRSAYPIVGAFEDLKNKDISYHSLALHEEFRDETKADISAFLKARFIAIKTKRKVAKDPWPDSNDLIRLVSLASQPSPLFIYAATLCRFVDDRAGRKRPMKQLELWLKQCDSNSSQLNQIYMPILRQVLLGSCEGGENCDVLDGEDHSQLLTILGSIILLATPLPARGLAALLDIDEDDVNHWLRNLHAVLDISSDYDAPVRLLHKSFSDFLLDTEKREKHPFWVDGKKVHKKLATQCLQRLSRGLKKDICNLRTLEKPRIEIDKYTIDTCFPPDIQYAFQYLVYHLKEGGGTIHNDDQLYAFLKCHFLHWLEALSFIGRLSESISMIDNLLAMLDPITSTEIARFLYDAKRFILRYYSIADLSPLQLYSSALIFAPQASIIRNRFQHYMPDWIPQQPKVESGWNAVLLTLEGHSDDVNSVTFSHDSTWLASASWDKTVKVWDVTTGRCLQTLEGHSGSMSSIAFSHDSTRLASVLDDKTVKVWDAVTGRCLLTLEGHSDSVSSVAFSYDSASESDTGKTLYPSSIAFSHNSTRLASALLDKTIKVWDAVTGCYIQTLKGHSGYISSIAFLHDSTQLVSASYDNTVKVWDAVTGDCLQTLEGYISNASSVAFSHDSTWLASASYDNTVKVWDTMTGDWVQTFEVCSSDVTSATFSHDSTRLALVSWDKIVKVWDVATGRCLQTLEGHSSINSIAFSHDSTRLASALDDNTVKVWDAVTGDHLQTPEDHSSSVSCFAFSHDSTRLASASWDKTVKVWDAVTGRCLLTLEGHSDSVSSVAFSHDSTWLASVSADKTVKVWDTITGLCLQTLEGYSSNASSIDLSYDSVSENGLASSEYQIIKVYHVSSVAFSYDSTQLVSALHSKIIEVWDTTTGHCLETLEGHSDVVTSVTFSHDSTLLASASWDKTVKVWDVATGRCIQTLSINASIYSISFDNTDSSLLTNIGRIKVDKTSPLLVDRGEIGHQGLGINHTWVTWNGRNLLWLPPGYRGGSYISPSGSIVAIGCLSGKVFIIGFSISNLMQAIDGYHS